MKKIFFPILIFLIAFPVFACERCMEMLDLQQTAQKADLVIVGQKIGEGPMVENYGPEWTEIKILEILKGEETDTSIKAATWYGMCRYGIELPNNNRYIIFLERLKGETTVEYGSVDSGCAVEKIGVNSDSDIDSLVARLGSGLARRKVGDNNINSNNINNDNINDIGIAQRKSDSAFGLDLFLGIFAIIFTLAILIFLIIKLFKKNKA